MLLGRIAPDLVVRHIEGLNQLETGLTRQDDLVDIAQLGRPVRIREVFAVLLDGLRALLLVGVTEQNVTAPRLPLRQFRPSGRPD